MSIAPPKGKKRFRFIKTLRSNPICLHVAFNIERLACRQRGSMSYPAEHRRLTKQKIVRSAGRLFNRRGFDTVSIDDVMADAGLTRGRFYSYFERKGDLYP